MSKQIFLPDDKTEIKRQYNLLKVNKLIEREFPSEEYSIRDPYQRDFTRILYSSSFRRLQGKMQILGIESSAFFRNRLTHSLEVSQIARSIANIIADEIPETYDNKDIYVIEAAALAHDIGHPAFGHKGERVLNKLASQHDLRFEGNAQNFRILRCLEKKEPSILGLNLTNRTLLSINKYIVKETLETSVDKFLYENDYN